MSTNWQETPVALTGIGMVTSVGHQAYPACAAIRAGISRMRELEMAQGPTGRPATLSLIGSPIKGVTDSYFGLGRWTRLATDALRDLSGMTGLTAAMLAQTPVFLGLPSQARTSSAPDDWKLLGARISQWLQLSGLRERIHLCQEGHSAALKQLKHAVAQIQQGRFTQAVVGGVDSLVEPDALARLLEEGRLKTAEHPVGLIPGEGAAFFLVESAAQAQRRKAEVLAWLEAPRLGHELTAPASGLPCDGRGLAEAITATFSGLTDRGVHTGLIISDLNGELFRAEEFANMVPRSLRHLRTPWQLWHAADCIGDTGAASSAISVCLAARALARGYARTNHALVCASSDAGLRGSVYLRSSRAGGASA
jgi:3-oxoacyl-[acyl-carrier-protein] synthase-1